MCHALLQDPKFFRLLLRVDQELADQARLREERSRDKAMLLRYPNQASHDAARNEALSTWYRKIQEPVYGLMQRHMEGLRSHGVLMVNDEDLNNMLHLMKQQHQLLTLNTMHKIVWTGRANILAYYHVLIAQELKPN